MSFRNEFGWKKFLFFFKLETGGYTIATTYIIQTIFIFILVLVSHAALPFEYSHYQIKYERIEICIVTVIMLTASILLFIGVRNRSHFLLLPWLSTYIILVFSSFLLSASEYTHITLVLQYYSLFFVELEFGMWHQRRRPWAYSTCGWVVKGFLIRALMIYAWFILFLLYHVFANEHRAQLSETQRTESRVVLSEISIPEETTNHNASDNIYVS